MASLPGCRRWGNVFLSPPTFNYRRDTLTACVDSRPQMRRRDLPGPCLVRESSGVYQKHADGSRNPPARRANTSMQHKVQYRDGEKEHDSNCTRYDLMNDIDD